jgi:hypothetical protein
MLKQGQPLKVETTPRLRPTVDAETIEPYLGIEYEQHL